MPRKKTKKIQPTKVLEGLDFLTQKSYFKRYEILAKRVSKLYNLSFTMSKGFGSFTEYDDKIKKYLMNIDPWRGDDPKFTLSDYNLIIRALIYHESAHILYTDFKVVKDNVTNLKICNKNIAEIADDLMSATPTKTDDDLTEAIYQYYYQKFLIDTLNSMEDASIEASVSSKHPESYASLIFLRNHVNSLEFDGIQKEFTDDELDDVASGAQPVNEKLITAIIAEIRNMATIGYRKYLTYHIMPTFYDDNEIREFEKLALWCRFVAPTTLERNIASKTLLDMLKKKILYPFAENMTKEYKSSLEDLKRKIDEDEKLIEEETKPSSSMSRSSSGSSGSKLGEGKGEGDLPIPKSLEKELCDKLKKEMEEAKKSHEKSSDGTENESESDTSGDSKKSDEDNEGEGKESEEYKDKSEKITGKESYIPEYNKSKEELSKEAEKELKKALKNSEKTFEKAQEEMDRSSIEGGEVLAENNALHEGVKTQEGMIEKFGDKISHEGKSVQSQIPHLMEYVNPLSKNMKKLLMYKARNRSLKGQFVGKLDMKSLYRAHTDGRVFRKDTEGEQTNVRICILVDESGSMHGRKIEKAIQGCYVVAKAAQKIKVPFSIYGHTENRNFELRQYVDYKNCFKKRSVDNIFKMRARNNNRDGLAIYKCLCSLAQNKGCIDEKQILVVISDGQPATWDYGGLEAEKEMQAIMNKFEKLYGISTIGIAIGSECKEVAAIYKNAVMVENVSELPTKMMEILRDIVL